MRPTGLQRAVSRVNLVQPSNSESLRCRGGRSAGDDYTTSDDEDDARRGYVFRDLELLGLSDVRATPHVAAHRFLATCTAQPAALNSTRAMRTRQAALAKQHSPLNPRHSTLKARAKQHSPLQP